MKEFVERLISMLEEAKYPSTDLKQGVIVNEIQQTDEVVLFNRAIQIINQLTEEYYNDKVNQTATAYAANIHMFGVDVTEKWNTAIEQTEALNKAYLRGRHDERIRRETT